MYTVQFRKRAESEEEQHLDFSCRCVPTVMYFLHEVELQSNLFVIIIDSY